ncbi:GNAT family N-acetyltransferase [Rhizobium halophilum]|uniref:GNAT family N-acetyltransferase n=1 Tax=Rhizobium halophilum TaxID=2846852 RepID=UPI00374D8209
MIVRQENPRDSEEIRALVTAAFDGAPHSNGTEGAIIDALREGGALSVSLVAEREGEIVGYVGFSPVQIDGRDIEWYGLGPVAVRPDRQRQGVGVRLIEAGLAQMKSIGAAGCVVLGDPGYYSRFGFHADPALSFPGVPQSISSVWILGHILGKGSSFIIRPSTERRRPLGAATSYIGRHEKSPSGERAFHSPCVDWRSCSSISGRLLGSAGQWVARG